MKNGYIIYVTTNGVVSQWEWHWYAVGGVIGGTSREVKGNSQFIIYQFLLAHLLFLDRPKHEFQFATMCGKLDSYGNFYTTVSPWTQL
jgi:hypothetical protein